MRLAIYLLTGLGFASSALAQPAPQPAPEAAAPAAPAAAPTPASSETAATEAPAAAPAAQPTAPAPAATLPAPTAAPEVPTPGEMEDMLSDQLGPAAAPSSEFTAPSPVFTLHGYMRMRGELMDSFWLGRRSIADFKATPPSATHNPADEDGQGPDPFSRFRPIESRTLPGAGAPGDLDCVDEDESGNGSCDVDTLQFANMRLRLSPQLNLSEDVRVKMTFDVFDNLVAGTAPASFYGTGPGNTGAFAGTDAPPSGDLGDSIKARRAWAEVRNRDLGELRFGRMPQEWGLGMYYNAGDGLDDDESTDLDRVLGITKLAGLYLSASYDFIAEGITAPDQARPLEQSQLDDVDQFTLSVAKRSSPEELSADLERGELVLNGGLQFTIRNQDSLDVAPAMMGASVVGSELRKIEATHYTSDLWGLLRYRGFRLEAEMVWVTGSMDSLTRAGDEIVVGNGDYDISQFGYALEGELRLLEDKLAIHLGHGLASGDSSVEGLSSDADFVSQLDGDNTVSSFRFHPSYRVDLIFWRNIMRQVTGAWYLRPGISYDFMRSDLGELLGARLDFVYSRATSFVQTWGNDPDLGLEIDASIYFRTEDGPEIDDGYHAMLQYGVFFPMRGLSYLHEDTDLDTAQTLRLVLGVVY